MTIATPEPLEPPLETFDVLPLSPEVRRAVDALGYTHPTPVQKAVFESVAAGRDVVVQARTGTGKTAAFGLPAVDRLVDESLHAPQILILSPTRELALQINRELEELAKFKKVTCTAVYGGASMQPQIDAIRGGAQIIAGTPGRVLDHLERGTLSPKTISAIILDESDEMLSMGFLPQITRIMEQLPAKHQSLLFSATLPPDVRRIAETRLTDPEFITLSGDHIGALSIDHYVYRSAGNKADELIQILEIENPESAIIFCNTRDQTKRISTALSRAGYPSDWLNADLAQNDREKVMKATREGKLRFLVCTDVAARGIDISHLTHVINADFPESTENYVHRTGRTGRAGKTGTAISLIAPQDVGNLYMLRLTYKIFPKERDLPSAGDIQTRKEADLVQFLYEAFRGKASTPAEQSVARRILTSDVAESIVSGLVRAHLNGHPDAESEAAETRRAKVTVEVERPKDKKHKKKGEKKEKSGKEKGHKQSEKPPKGARKEKDSPSAFSDSESSARVVLTPEQPSVASPKTIPSPTSTQANGVALALEPLEVVSASALLSAEERAFLSGDAAPEKGSRNRTQPRPRAENSSPNREPDDSVRIFVDVGKRDDIFKDDFLDTLEMGGINSADITYLNIRDTHTFLGVPPAAAERVIAALDGRQIGGLEVTAERARPRKN